MAIFDRLIRKTDEEKTEKITLAAYVKQALSELAANQDDDRKLCSEDPEVFKSFTKQIETRLRGEASKNGRGEALRDAEAMCAMSDNHLRAYLCLLPPCNGGAEVKEETLLSQLRYAGIAGGVLESQFRKVVSGKSYMHILPIAVGSAPVEGKNGAVTELFERRDPPSLAVADDSIIDFKDKDFALTVRTGDVICTIVPPVPGKDGYDVSGRALPCRQVTGAKVPVGENTELTADGCTLVASLDGVLYFEKDAFHVRKLNLAGTLSSRNDSISVKGDLYINGDVKGGASAEATGDIIINGSVLDGSVTSSGGSIRVQKGVQGVQGRTTLTAAMQLQALSLENAVIRTGGSIITEVLMNCDVVAGKMINVLGGHGLLVGGVIHAERRIACQKLGNLSGTRTVISVGCSPKLVTEWEQIKVELDQTSQIMDKLWENVTSLKKLGKLTEDQKNLMTKLVEQRNLYDEKRNTLRQEREVLRQQLKAASNGRVQCKELNPVAEIRIGEHRVEYKTKEVNCNIHMGESDIVIR